MQPKVIKTVSGAIRPCGFVRAREWRDDPHRLPHRSPQELREIEAEVAAVRAELELQINGPRREAA
jgi:hypothetical protein